MQVDSIRELQLDVCNGVTSVEKPFRQYTTTNIDGGRGRPSDGFEFGILWRVIIQSSESKRITSNEFSTKLKRIRSAHGNESWQLVDDIFGGA